MDTDMVIILDYHALQQSCLAMIIAAAISYASVRHFVQEARCPDVGPAIAVDSDVGELVKDTA